ncbi:MAG: hypothetical protein ACLVAA_12345 [Ruthenibacterium sp.]
MALELNGTSIPASGALQVNGTSLKEFKANGVLVWTSTPDPITIMKTGSSTGSWLGGGMLGSDAGYQAFSMSSQGYKNTTNGNIQAHGGIVDSKLRFGGEESTVGSNRALLVSNFTVNTKGFKYLRFKYYTENNNVPSSAPRAGIGPSGWNNTFNASLSFIRQNGTSASQTATLNLSSYQGTYAIKFDWHMQGNNDNNPYWAGRKCWVTEIYMYA